MLTSMITLPVRLGLRGAELGLRAGLAVAERAIDLLGEVVAPTASPRRSDNRPKPPSESSAAGQSGPSESPAADQGGAPDSEGGDPRSAAPSPDQMIAEQDAIAAERPAPKPPQPPPSPASPSSGPPEPKPPQAGRPDEGETLVDEVAEPGAEEGAGAQIRIAEPWDGYAQLKAPEVVDQLAGRDQAELAAVELYESAHRKRQTVIDAAKRELRRAESGS